jgi:hypothetical protein
LTLSATNSARATHNYSFTIAVDERKVASIPGFDRITEPSKNLALSDPGSGTITFGPTTQLLPGFGGVSSTLYRTVTVMGQAKGIDLVIDYDGRLGIGSHLNSGSSLHGNYANEARTQVGTDRSIPVKAIAPQEINKDISGIQNSTVDWDVTKDAQPASLDFENVCITNDEEVSTTVDVKVNWDNKGAVPDGMVSVTTHAYATNPSHRSVTVNITDTATSGPNQLFQFQDNGNVVLANTTQLIVDDTRDVPANLVVNKALHNVATASYFDTVFNEPVPGQTTATADGTVAEGTVANESAISPTPSRSPAPASASRWPRRRWRLRRQPGLRRGDKTTRPVDWPVDDVTADGSATFEKTVYLAAGTGSTTGTLTDTATLTPDDSSTKTAGPLDINIISSASGSVTVEKTTTVPVDDPTTFVFDVSTIRPTTSWAR